MRSGIEVEHGGWLALPHHARNCVAGEEGGTDETRTKTSSGPLQEGFRWAVVGKSLLVTNKAWDGKQFALVLSRVVLVVAVCYQQVECVIAQVSMPRPRQVVTKRKESRRFPS